MKAITLLISTILVFSSSMLLSKQETAIKTKRASDYYQGILNANQNKKWIVVLRESKKLVSGFPDSPFVSEAYFYQGVAFFEIADYDFSNDAFSKYLRNETTPKFFEEAIEYKYKIADKYFEGAKRHFLGLKKLPRILPAKDEALDIYEEIITTLPRHDLTAKSLYKKGLLLYEFSDFKLSVEAFQTLIRRFPKHHLAPEGYIGIQKVYLKQSRQEFPDPDVLELAEINLERFKRSFPGEPRINTVDMMLIEMKDHFAKDLFEIGNFYERTKKEDAAAIYYTKILAKYPGSTYAKKSKKHLVRLDHKKMKKPKKVSKPKKIKKPKKSKSAKVKK
ncbi:hypothetical protein COB11_02530 [Candidatus Aerophobetes bacterium]|uniref:Outer membrane lipoprotein BamD-like domain-containing protein n=1 Tax=Aerophobetes bacterium TaxID=2030807 RepID=A0A2A4YKF0_UNCAE|nr:MAG: hypothetical protein COB11_02530 [Candidatus Aerophobetes bacterium]